MWIRGKPVTGGVKPFDFNHIEESGLKKYSKLKLCGKPVDNNISG